MGFRIASAGHFYEMKKKKNRYLFIFIFLRNNSKYENKEIAMKTTGLRAGLSYGWLWPVPKASLAQGPQILYLYIYTIY